MDTFLPLHKAVRRMIETDHQIVIRDLQIIPGVGKAIAEDLYQLGIHHVNQLADRDPEELYHHLCQQTGSNIDRCMLYVFRCAVYFASTPDPDPELLKWWNWKDKKSYP